MPNVIKSQLIELINLGVAGGGNQSTKLQFQDQPYLRNKQILGIEVLLNGDMSASPSNRTPLTTAQAQKSYLTLYLNDPGNPNNVGEWIQNVPFTLLHRVQNTATDPFVREYYSLVGQVIYWEKCYVTFATALANTSDVSILLNVYFKG
jgi:hypothetical protein